MIKFSSFLILYCPNINAGFVETKRKTLFDNSNSEMVEKD